MAMGSVFKTGKICRALIGGLNTNISVGCAFDGHDSGSLMMETTKLRKLVTKRGTLEILIPLYCATNPVSSKTLAVRLKELENSSLS
jgi:hypothetical protein